MKKVSLFIAMSLDGYIADSEGSVEWLVGQGDDADNIDTYSEFAKDIDTVIMGWNTYHQIVTELSPNEWVYKINFTNESSVDLVKKLREESGKDIWICGGATLIQQGRYN